MPLRYAEAPQQDVQSFVPRTEFLVSGVQQAQQRHDASREAWSQNVLKSLDKGYVDDDAREAYLGQQRELFNNAVDKNYGNLSAGAGDIKNSIEIDRANPYHNLNAIQLDQAAKEQAMASKYGDKAIVLSDVAGTKLINDDGEWVSSNDNALQANVIESLDYDVEAEKQSADLRASVVDAQQALKAEWAAKGLPVNSAVQLRQLSETMVDDYLDNGGMATYMQNVGGVMAVDNSTNANFDPEVGVNQFQNPKGQLDQEKVRDFFKGQIIDKIFVEGIKEQPKAPRPITRVNVNVNNAGAAIPKEDNIGMSSIYKNSEITPEMFGNIKKELSTTNANISNLNSENARILTHMSNMGLKGIKSVSDLAKYTTNGIVDESKLPAGLSAQDITKYAAEIGDNLVAIEQAQIDKQRYSNIYGTVLSKVLDDISDEDYQDQFSSVLSNLGISDKQQLKKLGMSNAAEFKNFFKENYDVSKENFVKKYNKGDVAIDLGPEVLETLYDEYIKDGVLEGKVQDNLENNKYVNTVKFNTNTNSKSPESIHEKMYSQAFEDDPDRIFNNFTDQFGNKIADVELDQMIESEGTFTKNLRTVRDLFESEELGGENLELVFNNPGVNDMLSGANTHITIKNKHSGKVYARIPNARNGADPDFGREIAARKLSNALLVSADKGYEEKYLARSLAEYGAVTNSKNIWKSGAKFTPPGETSDVTIETKGGNITYKVKGYKVGNLQRLKIIDNEGNEVASNVKRESLYSYLYTVAGKEAAFYDTNASNMTAEKKDALNQKVDKISGDKLNNFRKATR